MATGKHWVIGRLMLGGIMAFGLAFGMVAAAQAQGYPDKSIKIVVPYPPGGFNDTLGRILASKLQDAWGQPTVVENRPGGGTLIGTQSVAKAPADGYTLLVVAFPFGANPGLFAKLPYDTVKEFAPIVLAGDTPNLLVVNPKMPVNTVQELVALAKSKPGVLNYASAGIGSSNHLSMELFKYMGGLDMKHVVYKGSAPAVTDLIAGHVDLMFDNTPNVLPQVEAGTLRALAVTSPQRSRLVPNVPTVAETGLPGYEVSVWYGLVAPAGTPQEIVDKLNGEINKMLQMPDVRERFLQQGVEPRGGTSDAFRQHIAGQIEKWTKLVATAGIQAK